MLFTSDLKFLAKCVAVPVKNELPQFYRADMKFALSKSPADLAAVLWQIQDHFEGDGFTHTSIDTRTHMLMQGMYPCIPGWHCDDFYRPDGENPDLLNVEAEAPQKHYMVIFGDCSRTEFLQKDIELVLPEHSGKNSPLYLHFDEVLEKINPPTLLVEPNKIYSFGPTAFHRGSPASKNGWRTFLRLTRSNHREARNELRYQSNVYITGRTGW